MVRLALFAMSLAGCELIADIPSHTLAPDDAGGGSGNDDGGEIDGGAGIDAKVGCDLDSECASGVCLVDRSCAMDSHIVYAAPAGTGAACSATVPCSVETAVTKLAAGIDVIKLAAGVYERSAQLDLAAPVTIAGTGATWHGNPGQDFMPLLVATGTPVVVIGIDFDLNGSPGITCSAGQLVLSRAKLHSGFYGVFGSQTCSATIDRTSFSANTFYGAYFSMGTTVAITNSYFTDHTPSITSLAALIFEQVTGTVSHTTFSNNTGDTPAIHCATSPNLKLTSLISFGHASPSVEPGCHVSYSVLDPGYAGPGTNNVTTNPMFIGAGNYHLSAASPVRGMGDPASTMAHDGDGEARPQPAGSRADPGADEVP